MPRRAYMRFDTGRRSSAAVAAAASAALHSGMADFDDLSFDRDRRPLPDPVLLEESPSFTPWLIVALVLLVAAIGALWYFVLRAKTEAPSKAVAQTTVDLPRPPARRAAEPGDAIDLPPLDQTDAVVRTLVGRLSSHPAVAAWLTTN